MNRRALLCFLVSAICFLIPVGLALAQATGGLVPCSGVSDCNVCTLLQLVQNFINFCIGTIALPIAALLFAYSGWLRMTSGANPSQVAKSNKVFKSVGIGFAITICAWLIVNLVITTIVTNPNVYGGGVVNWYTIGSCAQPGIGNGDRQGAGNSQTNSYQISDLFSGLFSQTPTNGAGSPITGGGGTTGGSGGSCPSGSTLNSNGDCIGNAFAMPAGGSCASGTFSTTFGYCVDGNQNYTGIPTGGTGCTPPATQNANGDCVVTGFVQPNNTSCPSGTFNTTLGYCADSNGNYTGALSSNLPLKSNGGSGCSSTVVAQAASQAGYPLTGAQASTLACISQSEDACGNGSVANTICWNTVCPNNANGSASTAAGAYQVLLSTNSVCYDNSVCEQAVNSTSALNCASAFSNGFIKNDPASQAKAAQCLQAAANVPCAAAAAACLVTKNNGSFSAWASQQDQKCVAGS